METTARHLRLLTETIAAVNSSLDLQEVLGLVASKVADALGTDACFVYLYDEREDELVLRATHGTRVEEMTRRPRMRPGEGITGAAAAERAPIAIAARAHLDPRFKLFPNLPEDEYESILAVPILARDKLEGALNVRTRKPREHSDAEIDLLVAIASQAATDSHGARRLLPDKGGRLHNSALMDLGALICVAKKPRCGECPVSDDCSAKQPESLPVKRPRRSIEPISEERAFIFEQGKLWLEPSQGPRWRGLWVLPKAESTNSRADHVEVYAITRFRVTMEVFIESRKCRSLAGYVPDGLPPMPSPHRRAVAAMLAGVHNGK